MELTREHLLARREQLIDQKAKAVASVNALIGAIQACEQMITDLETPEAELLVQPLMQTKS